MTPAQNTAAYIQGFEDGKRTAMAEIKRELAKQEQGEPVAWGNFKEDGTLVGLSQHPEDQANWTNKTPLYIAPQQRKPMTDEQAAFESVFKLPANCTKFEGGYAPTSYNAWDAQTFCARWEGWKARAAHGIKE